MVVATQLRPLSLCASPWRDEWQDMGISGYQHCIHDHSAISGVIPLHGRPTRSSKQVKGGAGPCRSSYVPLLLPLWVALLQVLPAPPYTTSVGHHTWHAQHRARQLHPEPLDEIAV